MIASQKIGTSFKDALNYNWNKLSHPRPEKRAELLESSLFSLEPGMILREMELIRSQRPELKKYVYHTSINFHLNDVLDNKTMLEIAHAYLKHMGFTDNQFLIFRHHDAGHPHLHLLANRVTNNGGVVSDSNNYKRSEAILRLLEEQYNLVAVEQSNHRSNERDSKGTKPQRSSPSADRHSFRTTYRNNGASAYQNNSAKPPRRAPTKNELEMIKRTGKVGPKLFLQEALNVLMAEPGITLAEFIRRCAKMNIYLLFNQASTARVSGITYFYGGFKAKGQGLGHRYKWAELIKTVDYDQVRDSKLIADTNNATKAIYGDFSAGQQSFSGKAETEVIIDFSKPNPDKKQEVVHNEYRTGEVSEPAEYNIGVNVSDDIDDEAILGRNRKRQQKARTNQR